MSTAPFSPPPAPAPTAAGRLAAGRPARAGLSARAVALQSAKQPTQSAQPMQQHPVQPAQPMQPRQPMQPVQPNVSVRRVLRTFERVVLREGGHRGALVNAYSAVLEGERRAAMRADARASLERLTDLTD